ncbi:thiamine-phosphate kinase [Candidatus Nitrosacidococcus tergens]|uniref:Multifunctional fusion protein n=1 Tax=Candidatus Nitrosacidococcus tergens TaxID=553981 RepID=A0A7G1Q850_9GAMM|nr:thiamine-phosphate kinase [Candidatus Nitrosacidococcus tergens]CAB1274895.1 thiamin-monophosphate kinase (modular protein) [Candidatus Nitrosacidococcus tergens]
MLKRTNARISAVQSLYQWHLTEQDINLSEIELSDFILDQNKPQGGIDKNYGEKILKGVLQNKNRLDEQMKPFLDRSINDLDPIEYAILRVGIFELLFCTDTPYRVVLNEATELAKILGAEKSHRYINAVLDKVAHQQNLAEKQKNQQSKNEILLVNQNNSDITPYTQESTEKLAPNTSPLPTPPKFQRMPHNKEKDSYITPNQDSLDEFSIIKQFFTRNIYFRRDVTLGIGDDCALVTVPENYELALTIDTLIEGVHFTKNTHPEALGHKALAVGLSDLAAMGATPAWATLALTIPTLNTKWLTQFSQGINNLLEKYKVQLIGGDTTRGEILTITLQLHGFVPKGKALRRDKAQVGDKVYITGTLGNAGLALQARLGKVVPTQEVLSYINRSLDWPQPRVLEALTLRSLAHAAIDISDGLIADLEHILIASKVGATINVDSIPISDFIKTTVGNDEALTIALTAGDDYELCIIAPDHAPIESVLSEFDCPCTFIGVIEENQGLHCCRSDGTLFSPKSKGYQHF